MKPQENFTPPPTEIEKAENEIVPKSPEVVIPAEISNEELKQYATVVETHIEKQATEMLPEAERRIESSARSMNVSPKTMGAVRQEQGLDAQLNEIQAEASQLANEARLDIEKVTAHENTGQVEHGTESEPERVSLTEINKLIESVSADLYDDKITDEQFLEKYDKPRGEARNDLKELITRREKEFIQTEFLRINPKAEVISEERGIYAIVLPNGEKLYGSIYSIIDAHENLGQIAPLAQEIQSGQKAETRSLMGIRTREGEGYKSIIVASGSFAQREINPYPADLDFSEHLDIQAEGKAEAAEILASLVSETVKQTADNPDLEFKELKCGIYPDDAPEAVRGKAIKWTKEETVSGEKILRDTKTGQEYKITLARASENPGMVKIDWLSVQDGDLKELTKVINVKASDRDGREIFNNRQKQSAFQEVYFGDTTEFGLTEMLRDPEVLKEYTDFLKKDVKKYSDPNHANYLKAAKRSYNLLKISGDIEGARSLAALFNSSTSELASRTETLSLLGSYLGESGKFDLARFDGQLDKMSALVASDKALFGEQEQGDIQQKLASVKEQLFRETLGRAEIQQIINELVPIFKEKFNVSAQKYLEGNKAFQNLSLE